MILPLTQGQRGAENTAASQPAGVHSEARLGSSGQNESTFPSKQDFWDDFALSIEAHDVEESVPGDTASIQHEGAKQADLNSDNEALFSDDVQVEVVETTNKPSDLQATRETGLQSVGFGGDTPEMVASSGMVRRSENAMAAASATDWPEAQLQNAVRRDQPAITAAGLNAVAGTFQGGSPRNEAKFGQNAMPGQTVKATLSEMASGTVITADTKQIEMPEQVETSGQAKMQIPAEAQSTNVQHRAPMADLSNAAAIARPDAVTWKTSDPKISLAERSSSFELALSLGGLEPVQRSSATMQLAHTVLSEPKTIAIVRDALVEMSAKGQREIEIHLSPKELGKLRFLMVTSEGQITVQISADKAEVLEALRRHAESFAQDLSSEGFGHAEFEFLHRGSGEDSLEYLEAQEGAGASPTGVEHEVRRWSIEAGRLDVRI